MSELASALVEALNERSLDRLAIALAPRLSMLVGESVSEAPWLDARGPGQPGRRPRAVHARRAVQPAMPGAGEDVFREYALRPAARASPAALRLSRPEPDGRDRSR